MDQPQQPAGRGVDRAGILCAVVPAGIGVISLAGWALKIPLLRSWGSSPVTIKANTAFCFVLISAALWLLRGEPARRSPRSVVARSLAGLVGIVGLISLAEYCFHWSSGLDQLLAAAPRDGHLASLPPGLMSPFTAACFALLGLTLVLLDWRTSGGYWLPEFLCFGVVVGATVGLLSLLLQPGDPYVCMALPTPFGFYAASAGALLLRPGRTCTRLISGIRPEDRLLRNILLPALVVSSISGWALSRASLFSGGGDWDRQSLLAVWCYLLFVGFIIWTALLLYRGEEERNRIESVARDSERRLAGILHSAMDAIVSVDDHLRVILFNAAAERMFGVPAALARGEPLDRFIPPHTRHTHNGRMLAFAQSRAASRAMASGRTVQALRADGEEFPAEVSISQVETGGRRVYTAIIRDVTERRKAEAERLRLVSMMESTDNAIINAGLDGRVAHWNAAAERLFGYTRQEMIGQSLTRLVPPELAADLAAIFAEVRQGRLARRDNTQRLRKDGSRVRVSLVVSPLRDTGGHIVGTTAVLLDITERVRAEMLLREQAALLDLAPALVRDMEDRIVLWGGGAEKIYGYGRQQAIGQSSHSLLQTRFPLPLLEIRRILMEQGQWEGELLHTRCDGEQLTVHALWVLHRDAEGRPRHTLEVVTDLTAIRRAEQALQAQAAELARSNRDLEQFAYAASHDLQEPLRAVTGCLEMLERRCQGQVDARGITYMMLAVDGARRMKSLIDDLLAFSRVGRLGAGMGPVDCATAVSDALGNLALAVEEQHAAVICDPLPQVHADRGQLTLCFQNLIGNALKFHGARPPEIRIQAEPREGEWVISVADNGIGIEPQYFDRIFVIFQRLHTRREYPGTGMGLALCKRIIERHNGRIWVESEPGRGSTFRFTLRAAASKS